MVTVSECERVSERVSAGGSAVPVGRVTAVPLFSPQDKEMEKQRLLYQQSRLHNRGAAEMVLQMISACKGSRQTHRHAQSRT